MAIGAGISLYHGGGRDKGKMGGQQLEVGALLISLMSCLRFLLPFPPWVSKTPDTINLS